MNSIMCELLGVSEHTRKSDNSKYYSIRVILDNRISVMFFKEKELFDNLSKLERLAPINLFGDLRIKDDTSFIFYPKNFEI